MKAIDSMPPSLHELEQVRCDWLDRIRPIIKHKVEIIGFAQTRLIIAADGSIDRTEVILTEDQCKMMDQLDDVIEQMKPTALRDKTD